MTHYSNASCTTPIMSCTTSSLNGANLYITSDQDITIGNQVLSPVSCANGILFTACCSKTLINCFITVFTGELLFVFFYLYFDLVQMRSAILCNKRICMYVCMYVCIIDSH